MSTTSSTATRSLLWSGWLRSSAAVEPHREVGPRDHGTEQPDDGEQEQDDQRHDGAPPLVSGTGACSLTTGWGWLPSLRTAIVAANPSASTRTGRTVRAVATVFSPLV